MKKQVVIVDDSKFTTGQLQKFMEDSMDFEVVGIGHNGQEGIDLYKKFRPDLVTLDITMPIKDGSTAMKEILQEFPDAKVLIVTSILPNASNRFLMHGSSGVIQKPFKMNDPEYLEEVRRVICSVWEL